MPKGVPKMVTTNAANPHEWHPDIPEGFWDMSTAEKKVGNSVMAIFKRTAWCMVGLPLYDNGDQREAKVARRAAGIELMADVFA